MYIELPIIRKVVKHEVNTKVEGRTKQLNPQTFRDANLLAKQYISNSKHISKMHKHLQLL